MMKNQEKTGISASSIGGRDSSTRLIGKSVNSTSAPTGSGKDASIVIKASVNSDSVLSLSGKDPSALVGASVNSTHLSSAAASGDTIVAATYPDLRTSDTSSPTDVSLGDADTMGLKHSKSDHCGLVRRDKHKDSKACFGRKYISKSQDNLSSQKKGKPLATVVEATKPRDNAASLARAGATRVEKNKENVLKDSEKTPIFAKPKPVKPSSFITNIRKTSSTQSIDKTNQTSASIKSSSSKSSNNLAIKRAQSTQNVSKDNFIKKRTSAPADVMAYNAELLANFEKDKKVLEVRISELAKVAEGRKGEIEKYKYEIKRLKDRLLNSGDMEEMELLRNQNKQLLDRLQELGFPAEQITDSEKLMLKHSRARTARSHDSSSDFGLQTSISCDSLSTEGSGAKGGTHPMSMSSTGGRGSVLVMGAGGSDLRRSTSLSASEPGMSLPDLCGTPDHPSVLSLDTANWDKQSNKSANSDGALSEVSVACLTERILQMEETNYSTTEELQATLQELADLQDSVNELAEENTKLTDEKAVLLESLCTQTEKLENTRIQLEQLKCLLISGELPDKSEIEIHLLGLLKSAQEEREELMRKQFEWSNALQTLENECKEVHEAGEMLRDRYGALEDAHTSLKAEKEAIGKQLWQIRESQAAEQAEVSRLKTLLENEKSKVVELETDRCAQDKTDVGALLDIARQDKDRTDQKVADLMETLALSQCEVARLKDCLTCKDQELLAVRSNAKSQASDLHFRIEVAEKEKLEVEREADSLRLHVDQLEVACDSHLQDKKNLTAKLQEIQVELRSCRQQRQIMEAELNEVSSKHDVESEEWKQFQRDLQMAVVIANNFSQETQEKMDKLNADNSQLLEQVSAMRAEVDKLLQENRVLKQTAEDFSPRKHSILTNAELKGKVYSSMDRELAALRDGRPQLDQRSQSISVKSLIRCIEEQVKSGCSSIQSSHSESRRSSTSSETSLLDLVKPASPLPGLDSPLSPVKDFSLRASSFKSRSIERSPQPRHISGGTAVVGIPSPEGTGKGLLGSRMDGCEPAVAKGQISSILKDRNTPRRGSGIVETDTSKKEPLGRDPLSSLAKLMKGSKRNALLKWCQLKTIPYSNVDITNFSSSWNDGLGFCALLHSYVSDRIPYQELNSEDKRRNFTIAFNAAESIGIKETLNINDMVSMERPDWQAVMNYVTAIYRHFEVDKP